MSDKQISLKIPHKLRDKIKHEIIDLDISMNKFFIQLAYDYLDGSTKDVRQTKFKNSTNYQSK